MLLLDTHVLLWWLTNDQNLRHAVRVAIAQPQRLVFVSAASAWEMSIKRTQGKIEMPEDLEAQLLRHRFQALHITTQHALAAGRFPYVTAAHLTAC